ncbi:MAG: cytochrome c biogenesis protein CcsA [Fuerstiella sp.]|nr:cytochrome c biogenesis protein CcsA [Fuerstiella sp.]MCP4858999.1 cytochrome c biogenesis protein CcsA [Fuerstiella sp.]
MSTTILPGDLTGGDDAKSSEDRFTAIVWQSVDALASLKLTCLLLLLGMFIVFVGSLAQARKDVWLVVGEYFRTYVAYIDVADLFPPSMFPGWVDFDWDSLGAFRVIPFPGGWTIGWIMLANLTAAHLLRFKVRVRGGRMTAGIVITAVGAVLTAAVVVTGNGQTGVESGNSALSPEQIWYLMLGVLGVAAVVPLGVAFTKSGTSRPERILLGSVGVTLAAVLVYFLVGGEAARLNLSSMRILWQLLKGSACALVMLVGCNLLFEKRGGIVLLHAGVALLMFSELQVGFYAKENMLTLVEGQKLSFLRDMRERELAVVHRLDDDTEKVVAVPEAVLIAASAAAQDGKPEGQVVETPSLPFVLRVDRFHRNSRLRSVMPGEETSGTTGLGTFATSVEVDAVTGMDDSHDLSSLQVTLLDRDSGKELETLLLAQDVSEMRTVPIAEQATVDGNDYQLYLRFQRNYRDYEVELLDVSRTNYVGSATPRDYRSEIVIRDGETGAAEEFTLWMNNPLRYKGETFYQSGYNETPDGTEMTTLSVVRNTGWMLPYIACMIVTVGMFAKFGQTLGRYLSRMGRSGATDTAAEEGDDPSTASMPAGIRKPAAATTVPDTLVADEKPKSVWPVAVPVIVVLLSGGWLMSKARPPKADPEAMNLFAFSQLPVAWKGRAQPVDSFARTELLMTSHKSTFKGELSAGELDVKEKHDQIIERVQKYWPSVSTESLEEFSGQYDEWIEQIVKLTSSGRDAVEERMRGVMTLRMPAVRWFLDVVARPELARRHRVIKIDDDQVLSLLGLEKRAGLAYSLQEIQENLSAMQKIHQEGQRLEMAGQEHRMTQLQRRVVSLFRTVSRVDSWQNVFLVRESEGLLDSVVKAWWVLDRLGNSPAIMAVPTGSENEQRAWETLIGASAMRNVASDLAKHGLTTDDEVLDFVQNKLPRELVGKAVEGSVTILQSAVEESARAAGEELKPDAVKTRAAEAALTLADPFLRRVLEIISKAETGATTDEMLGGMSDSDFAEVASERISSEVFQVFEALNEKENDKRLTEIRRRMQNAGTNDESALAAQMNLELVRLALDDLQARTDGMLYQADSASTLQTSTKAMADIFAAWSVSDVAAFNESVSGYQKFLADTPLPHVDASVVSLEAFFNFFEPFMKSIYLYLPVLLMSFFSWIVWPKTLRRTAFWLMALAFVTHTVALLMRMYISGRPPVTNLYSSAIFIGWAAVGASFLIERLLKNGIGTILGASVGMATLVVAHYLARDEGDTLGVMQAVLDTTFWLATHVVCIALGYSATFLAGSMAVAYCFISSFGAPKSQSDLPQLGKMIYGVLCFAVFFSLIGTVLGGLWADDSWGRFWGWDPKENGAMLIVMWNALILHARWDKLVRDYGTAILAMFGNIVTAWSWFGVNELKAGLHTYGFTEGRLLALLVFIGLQGLIIFGAMIPLIGKSASDRIEPAA